MTGFHDQRIAAIKPAVHFAKPISSALQLDAEVSTAPDSGTRTAGLPPAFSASTIARSVPTRKTTEQYRQQSDHRPSEIGGRSCSLLALVQSRYCDRSGSILGARQVHHVAKVPVR
jgi:hypothetical protein